MKNEEIIELIDAFWRFDNNQQPMSSWHDKQDLLGKLRKMIQKTDRGHLIHNTFYLTDSEKELFEKYKSDRVRFILGGGIGVGVECRDKKGKWKNITDYESW
jgi:hypothetical protein